MNPGSDNLESLVRFPSRILENLFDFNLLFLIEVQVLGKALHSLLRRLPVAAATVPCSSRGGGGVR